MSQIKWEVRLIEITEDRMASEPRQICLGLVPGDYEPMAAETLARFGPDADFKELKPEITALANEGPIDLRIVHHWDAGPRGEELNWDTLHYDLAKVIKTRWPDLDERIAAKVQRQLATSFLPDKHMCLQICKDVPQSERLGLPVLQVFLVPKACLVKGAIHYEKLALHCATSPPKRVCETLVKLGLREGQIEVNFKAGAQASHDLVYEWGTWFGGVQKLIDRKRNMGKREGRKER